MGLSSDKRKMRFCDILYTFQHYSAACTEGMTFLASKLFEPHLIHSCSKCQIPRFDGTISSLKNKEALWDKYAIGTHTIRATIQRSQTRTVALNLELAINIKTATK
jgi:hypothetical protein